MVVKIRKTIKTTNTNPRATIRSRKSILRFIDGIGNFIYNGLFIYKPYKYMIKVPDYCRYLKKISCDATFSVEMIKASWVSGGRRYQ